MGDTSLAKAHKANLRPAPEPDHFPMDSLLTNTPSFWPMCESQQSGVRGTVSRTLTLLRLEGPCIVVG